jgi:hypothetical protein
MNWTQTLIDWHAKFKTFLNEKTYLETQNNNGIKIKWWYTHKRIKSAYKQLIKLVENDTIFTYVRMPQLNIPKTTNLMEGDINSQIRNLLKIHRGMPIKHRKILTERFLWSKREK